MSLAIDVKSLHKKFGHVAALNGVSLTVSAGEIYGFLGPNGAGKTTTIRTMMDFIRADSGSIKLLGHDPKLAPEQVKLQLGFLPSESQLYINWTGQKHIDFLEDVKGRAERANELVKRLDLDPKLKVKTLSTGNRQKLGLVLALMHEPKLLIMDEPTQGLDPFLQNEIYDILREFKSRGGTVFMSSHNLPEVERVCDRAAIIKAGKVVAVEDIRDLRTKQIYEVTLVFAGKPPIDSLASKGVEVTKSNGHTVLLKVKGDINAFIKHIGRFKLKHLEIASASLEEVFIEHYQE